MMGPTHALFGVTAYVLAVTGCVFAGVGVLLPVGFTGWAVAVLAAAASALFPDIDHPDSTVSKFLWPIAWLFRKLTGAKHRGLTHRWYFALIVAIIIGLWQWPLLIPTIIGYSSHLIGDWIFNGRAAWHPKTNGFIESRLVRPALWGLLALSSVVLVGHGLANLAFA